MVQEEQMSRISNSIKENHNKPALIPFIVSGYPDIEATKDLLYLFQEHKVAAIELGIPFSDPLADGPIIQNAAKKAIESGINLDKIFDLLLEVKEDIKTPIVLFSYFNPILHYGLNNFISRAKLANVAGVIIPDLPVEESEEFSRLCQENNIDFIMLIAPTSDKDRIRTIAKKATGFIYLVSSTGVTGVRDNFSETLLSIITEVKNTIDTPIAVGFGVSKPEHISNLKELNVDGAIVGSALVKIIDQYKDDKALLLGKISEYLDSLYKA
ncbi:MAG: tryptophan synthase subunit alpha [Candidatus Melainabacteria bacterium GWF2_32_7]|nr:MAG: tryptophan synthase subunit alpha [Candidatus Melainabacteria bacterium GWF2_32_7]